MPAASAASLALPKYPPRSYVHICLQNAKRRRRGEAAPSPPTSNPLFPGAPRRSSEPVPPVPGWPTVAPAPALPPATTVADDQPPIADVSA